MEVTARLVYRTPTRRDLRHGTDPHFQRATPRRRSRRQGTPALLRRDPKGNGIRPWLVDSPQGANTKLTTYRVNLAGTCDGRHLLQSWEVLSTIPRSLFII